MTDVMALESVATRKTCTTWKPKYQVCVLSSIWLYVTYPACLAIKRHTIGTSAINTASMTDGSRPVITPRMALGMSRIHSSHGNRSAR